MSEQDTTAIVLAAGRGRRMGGSTPKQYLLLGGRPVLCHSLHVLQESFVNRIILVTGEDEVEYCQKEIVEKYHFTKVTSVIPGGEERYHSVYQGICAADDCGYLLIHDGARPFLSKGILQRCDRAVKEYGACVVGMPVKDTIKITNDQGFAAETPDRDRIWMIQTPQAFSYSLIRNAYDRMMQEEKTILCDRIKITDDAMVVERFTQHKVKLIEGSYSNIKITTPEDLRIAEALRICENIE